MKKLSGGLINVKKFLSVLLLFVFISAPAFALSDAEYLKMKRNNQNFARADRKLTNTWNKLKKSLPEYVFEQLQKDQRSWIKKGRDDAAKSYMNEGYSRTEAYTLATNDRANRLPEIASEFEDGNAKPKPKQKSPKAKPEKIKKPEPEKSMEIEDDDDDDRKGEIEEDRFKNLEANSDGIIYAGNYSRRDKNAFMTVLVIDQASNEAEVTISITNPEKTWSAKGWINEENVLELFDRNYSGCQVNLTFSKKQVKIESSPDSDWDEVLDYNVRLDGVYDRN